VLRGCSFFLEGPRTWRDLQDPKEARRGWDGPGLRGRAPPTASPRSGEDLAGNYTTMARPLCSSRARGSDCEPARAPTHRLDPGLRFDGDGRAISGAR